MTNTHEYGRNFEAEVYDESYFQGGSKSGYTNYGNAKKIVEDCFRIIHEVMVKAVGPKATFVDVGCAYGFGVEKLNSLGWKGFGIDISSYAIRRGKELTNAKLITKNAMNSKTWDEVDVDLVVSTEFFEHIPSDKVDSVISNMAKSAKWGAFIINARTYPGQTTKDAELDVGHMNNHSMSWWIEKFAKYGELDFDAMYNLSKKAEAYNARVHWHNRYIVIKFKESTAV